MKESVVHRAVVTAHLILVTSTLGSVWLFLSNGILVKNVQTKLVHD